jgi:predicted amidohydrolase
VQPSPDPAGTLRVALFQGPAAAGDVATNVAAIEAAAQQAAAEGAAVMVTPEMSATGYNIGALSTQRAEPPDGPLHTTMASIAVKHSMAIIYGYPERSADGNYNTVVAIGPAGETLGSHHKVHLYADLDRNLFRRGDNLVSQFDLSGLTCGLAICYDIEFPELARAHADAGTEVLFVPTALMRPFEVVSQVVVPARAYENQLFVVYANRCDTEDELHYCGLSCAVGPDGADLVRAAEGEELLLVDIDPTALAAERSVNTNLVDRRHDLYSAAHQQQSGKPR